MEGNSAKKRYKTALFRYFTETNFPNKTYFGVSTRDITHPAKRVIKHVRKLENVHSPPNGCRIGVIVTV